MSKEALESYRILDAKTHLEATPEDIGDWIEGSPVQPYLQIQDDDTSFFLTNAIIKLYKPGTLISRDADAVSLEKDSDQPNVCNQPHIENSGDSTNIPKTPFQSIPHQTYIDDIEQYSSSHKIEDQESCYVLKETIDANTADPFSLKSFGSQISLYSMFEKDLIIARVKTKGILKSNSENICHPSPSNLKSSTSYQEASSSDPTLTTHGQSLPLASKQRKDVGLDDGGSTESECNYFYYNAHYLNSLLYDLDLKNSSISGYTIFNPLDQTQVIESIEYFRVGRFLNCNYSYDTISKEQKKKEMYNRIKIVINQAMLKKPTQLSNEKNSIDIHNDSGLTQESGKMRDNILKVPGLVDFTQSKPESEPEQDPKTGHSVLNMEADTNHLKKRTNKQEKKNHGGTLNTKTRVEYYQKYKTGKRIFHSKKEIADIVNRKNLETLMKMISEQNIEALDKAKTLSVSENFKLITVNSNFRQSSEQPKVPKKLPHTDSISELISSCIPDSGFFITPFVYTHIMHKKLNRLAKIKKCVKVLQTPIQLDTTGEFEKLKAEENHIFLSNKTFQTHGYTQHHSDSKQSSKSRSSTDTNIMSSKSSTDTNATTEDLYGGGRQIHNLDLNVQRVYRASMSHLNTLFVYKAEYICNSDELKTNTDLQQYFLNNQLPDDYNIEMVIVKDVFSISENKNINCKIGLMNSENTQCTIAHPLFKDNSVFISILKRDSGVNNNEHNGAFLPSLLTRIKNIFKSKPITQNDELGNHQDVNTEIVSRFTPQSELKQEEDHKRSWRNRFLGGRLYLGLVILISLKVILILYLALRIHYMHKKKA